MAKQVDVDKLIDVGAKTLAATAAFMAGDRFLFGGSITPEPLSGIVGLVVCLGLGVVAWRLVKP